MQKKTDLTKLSEDYRNALLEVEQVPGFKVWMLGFITFGGRINWNGIADEIQNSQRERGSQLPRK